MKRSSRAPVRAARSRTAGGARPRGLVVALLLSAAASPLGADVGSVSVDGESVPPALFAVHASRLASGRNCPPPSDERVREEVVLLHLLARAGERAGLTLDGADRIGEERARTALARLPSNATAAERSHLEHALLQELADGYRERLIGPIGDEEIALRYRRAVEDRHPALVDVVLLRYTMHEFGDEAARERAMRELELGTPYETLVESGRFGTFYEHDDEAWRLLQPWLRIEPEVGELEAGDLVRPRDFRASVLHVSETKVLSRIRPHQPINGDDLHAWRTVLHMIGRERRRALEQRLRRDAVVEEDGVPVPAPEASGPNAPPEC